MDFCDGTNMRTKKGHIFSQPELYWCVLQTCSYKGKQARLYRAPALQIASVMEKVPPELLMSD